MIMVALTTGLVLLCVTAYALCAASHDADKHMETLMQDHARQS